MKPIIMKISKVFAALAMAVLTITPLAIQAASQPRDNDANAIMWGGAYSKSEFNTKLANGDGHNSSADLKQIYFNENRGITEANFNSSDTVDGIVYKDGRVTVNGKTVATNAISIGRTQKLSSVRDGSVWARPTTSSFVASSIPAFVNMEGGIFKYAIIKSCGNGVKATPVPAPAPVITPAPTPVPTPSPEPKVFECLKLTPSTVDPQRPTKFRFTVASNLSSNVRLTGYTFSFSDKSPSINTSASIPYIEREVKTGTLKVYAQVRTSAGTTAKSESCSATAMVTAPASTPSPTPAPVEPSGTGEVLGVTLPEAGAETALGGALGITALGAAARSYLRSRKSVLASLRGKRTQP